MLRHKLHTNYAPLRIAIIAVWILSLATVGVSPLYYVSTSSSSSAVAESQTDSVTGNQIENGSENQRGAVALRLTYNPFVVDSPNGLFDSDGGMTHNEPVGSPVVLWLVSAGASLTISSSNSTKVIRTSHLSTIADIQNQHSATGVFTATPITAEHPTKRFAATLVGQKPSGVS